MDSHTERKEKPQSAQRRAQSPQRILRELCADLCGLCGKKQGSHIEKAANQIKRPRKLRGLCCLKKIFPKIKGISQYDGCGANDSQVEGRFLNFQEYTIIPKSQGIGILLP